VCIAESLIEHCEGSLAYLGFWFMEHHLARPYPGLVGSGTRVNGIFQILICQLGPKL